MIHDTDEPDMKTLHVNAKSALHCLTASKNNYFIITNFFSPASVLGVTELAGFRFSTFSYSINSVSLTSHSALVTGSARLRRLSCD